MTIALFEACPAKRACSGDLHIKVSIVIAGYTRVKTDGGFFGCLHTTFMFFRRSVACNAPPTFPLKPLVPASEPPGATRDVTVTQQVARQWKVHPLQPVVFTQMIASMGLYPNRDHGQPRTEHRWGALGVLSLVSHREAP